MKMTWFGTATITVEHAGYKILFDPFIPMNPKLREAFLAQDFSDADSIFISHGHFDHAADLEHFLSLNNAPVYCNQSTAEMLRSKGLDHQRIKIISRSDNLQMGPFKITVLKGKHIIFDLPIIFKTILKMRWLFNLGSLVKIGILNRRYAEGDTYVFDISADNTRILHLGSLNLDEQEPYPDNVDIMTIPYQGRSDLNSYALAIIDRIHPRALYFHHFDDAFPPMSSYVDPEGFRTYINKLRPAINCIIPRYFEPLSL